MYFTDEGEFEGLILLVPRDSSRSETQISDEMHQVAWERPDKSEEGLRMAEDKSLIFV